MPEPHAPVTASRPGENPAIDVVVVGSGIAGLSAAVAAAEQLAGAGTVTVIDRMNETEAGGNTRWTGAYFRMDDVYEPADGFAEDMTAFSGGRVPREYVDTLLERLPDTMEWIQGHGARFERAIEKFSFFVTSTRPRLRPRGGGEGLLRALKQAAVALGVEFRYEVTIDGLAVSDDGRVTGVSGHDASGAALAVTAHTVVIASGGFEGDLELLTEHLGENAATLLPIAPSTSNNRGEGIQIALDAGAARAGQWDNFHVEPIDPRSEDPEALVMVFPYGILVNHRGERFLDEGRATVDETYEEVTHTIWSRENGSVWFITDQRFDRVTARERGIRTSVKPIVADTVDGLADALELPREVLQDTIGRLNAATPEDADARFDWRVCDGVGTHGLDPPKSNWAVPIDQAPFIAYPVGCGIVFTFGGLAVDICGHVLRDDDTSIPGLYAAGECTGLYHQKYTGGTSVLRGMIFGRVAGTEAALDASKQDNRRARETLNG